jgi:hypothetical protein
MATTQTTHLSETALKAALWDRPDMSRADVVRTLQSPGTSAYFWLLGRFVEYLPPRDVLSLVERDTLYAVFPKLRIWGKVAVEKARALFSDTYRTTA